MIRKSLVAKLWLTIVGMVFLVLALLSILLQQLFNKYVVQREMEQLTNLASTVQTVMNHGANPTLEAQVAQKMARNVQQAQITYAETLNSNPTLSTAFHNMTAIEQRSFRLGKPVSIRSNIHGENAISVYVILNPSKPSPGILAVTQKMSVIDQPSHQIRNLIIFDTILGIVLATGLAFVVSKNLSRPLIEMNRAAEAMAKGKFEQQVEVVTSDEVGRLGQTFNALASELAKTIAQLSIERDQLSSILASLQDGVIATDLAGQVTLANPPALRQLRALSVAEDGIAKIDQLPERLMSLFRNVLNLKEPIVREAIWEGRTMAITMLPLYEVDATRIRGTLAVLRDVTEERRLDRLRKDFIANVSHELRTPLSMMQGYAEALLDDISDEPEMRRELTEIIHDESLRMKRLVNDLLNLAQLESGQFQMSMEYLDFTLIMRRIGRKFQALALEHGVMFEMVVPPESVTMFADADRIEQVFTNLLDNAFRHTPKGKISFVADIRDHYAYIRVADTGAGMSEEDLPFIFERFYKADKARTRSKSGTGLGLAIARHIVIEHHGDILVESRVGHGTTFTVLLPVVSPP